MSIAGSTDPRIEAFKPGEIHCGVRSSRIRFCRNRPRFRQGSTYCSTAVRLANASILLPFRSVITDRPADRNSSCTPEVSICPYLPSGNASMTVPSASLETRTLSGRRTVSEPSEYTVCRNRSKKTSRFSPVGCLFIFRPSRNVIRWPYRTVAKPLPPGFRLSPTPPRAAITIFPLGYRHRCWPSGNVVQNRPSSQCIS